MLKKLQSSRRKNVVELHEGGKEGGDRTSHPALRSSKLLLHLQNKTYRGCRKTEEQLSHNSGGVIVKKKPSESCFPGVIKKFS